MAAPTGLEWVDEPRISDGSVVYKYRNSSDKDATYVGEIVNLVPANGTNVVQTYQLDSLAAGAEQETYVPAGSDLPDGTATAYVSVQSSSGGEEFDGLIEFELKGAIAGGVLCAEGDQPDAADLEVHVEDFRLDDQEIVLHYRIKGTAHFDMLSASFTLFDPDGGTGWAESTSPGVDREDIVRVAVPFDEVLGNQSGWAIEAALAVGSTKENVQSFVRVRLPVERIDDTVVASEGFSVVPD